MTNLERLRLKARLSPRALATAAGISQPTVLSLERDADEAKPRTETLGKLADFFTERFGTEIEPAILLMEFDGSSVTPRLERGPARLGKTPGGERRQPEGKAAA